MVVDPGRPFVARPPGAQEPDTFRQFQELQRVLSEIALRLDDLEARVAALEGP